VFGVDLFFASPESPAGSGVHFTAFLANAGHWRLLVDLVLLGMFGGFYIVPLYALIQTRSEKSHQSRVIAANNILNAFFMVISALVSMLLFAAGLSIPQLFLAAALFNVAVAIYIYGLVPEFLYRFLAWLLVHSVYRLESSGWERIPDEGPAVIVCNHVSFVDPLVITAASPRPIRFVMDHRIYKMPVMSFVFREYRAIPIAGAKEDPVVMEKAFDEVARALDAGELVCIFPEGRITENGDVGRFRPGITRVLARNPVPVVPLALRGLWGSFFSRKAGRAMSNPRHLRPFSKIALAAGEPVPAAQATPEALQGIVTALRGSWQ
jgi:1-acyl-sn-glycerol-3-phosphate acyltransferase